MKKLNVILDETTIINFSFFKKLIGRYLITSLLVPIVVFSFFFYRYSNQNTIFLQSKTFKNVANDSDSPTLAIARIVGENQEGLNSAEIIGMFSSLDFIRKLAEDIYAHKNFEKIIFSSLVSKKRMTLEEQLQGCEGDSECSIKTIMALVSGLYHIEQDQNVMKKFVIKVKTLDKATTVFLLNLLEKTIQEERKGSIKHILLQQKNVMQDLSLKKRTDLKLQDPLELENKNRALKEELKQMTDRIQIVQGHYHSKKVELDLMESKLEQTKNTLKKRFTQREVNLSRKAKALNKKIDKLRQDINAIEVSLADLSTEDQGIIVDLKNEMKAAQKELRAIPNYRKYIGSREDFLKKKDVNSNDITFEAQVKRRQFARIESELKSLQVKITEKSKLQKDIEARLDTIKPDLEYIKLLEKKLVQLTLLESTVVSDFVFSKNVTDVSTYKRTSRGKMLLFAGFVSFFLLFTVVLLRYLLDTKIYDEYELKKNFENLEVIGNTPDFN
jgi:hypothetical protein